jgi:hypothetical protein
VSDDADDSTDDADPLEVRAFEREEWRRRTWYGKLCYLLEALALYTAFAVVTILTARSAVVR